MLAPAQYWIAPVKFDTIIPLVSTWNLLITQNLPNLMPQSNSEILFHFECIHEISFHSSSCDRPAGMLE